MEFRDTVQPGKTLKEGVKQGGVASEEGVWLGRVLRGRRRGLMSYMPPLGLRFLTPILDGLVGLVSRKVLAGFTAAQTDGMPV